MFLFAIGYGVGPQFVRGIAKDGLPQAVFAAVVCVFCLLAPFIGAKLAGYDVGSAAGPLCGFADDLGFDGACHRCDQSLRACRPRKARSFWMRMPVAYAVTYIFGTVGSALVLALLGPALLGIDLETACKRYEEKHGGKRGLGWSRYRLVPIRVARLTGSPKTDAPWAKRCRKPRRSCPEERVFIERIRRGGKIIDATADAVIQAGDVVADCRAARRAGEPDRASRARSGRPRAAGGAGRGRRCLRHQQGRRRQDPSRVGEIAGGARRLPAQRSRAGRPPRIFRSCPTPSCTAAIS